MSRQAVTEPPLVSPRFIVITLSALTYFVAFAMLLPTLPLYVERTLGGSKIEVGIVVGAFAWSALLVRPALGRLGDRYGRRVLLAGGAAITAVSVFFYPVWLSIPALVALRIISGVGESGTFVGAATATQDFATDERRGEASAYFSLAIYVGLGIGPALGEFVSDRHGFDGVTRVAAALSLVSVVLAFAVPRHDHAQMAEQVAASTSAPQGFLHRAAVLPGVLLTLSLIGFVGFTTFLAAYVDELTDGAVSAGRFFLIYAAIVIVFRLFMASLPDRLGARRGGTLAFAFIGTGLFLVAAIPSIIGVYLGTVVLAFGVAFNYPALFLLVMAETEAHERSHSVASFGFFFDLANAIGAPLLGLVITVTGGERYAFAVGAVAAALGLVGLRRLTAPNRPSALESDYGRVE